MLCSRDLDVLRAWQRIMDNRRHTTYVCSKLHEGLEANKNYETTTTTTKMGTQWVHVSTAVNNAGWMLVDGSRIPQPDLVAFVGLLSGSCTAANVSSWIPSSLRLIFVAFDRFRTLIHDHLLILAHITLTLQRQSHKTKTMSTASRGSKKITEPENPWLFIGLSRLVYKLTGKAQCFSLSSLSSLQVICARALVVTLRVTVMRKSFIALSQS